MLIDRSQRSLVSPRTAMVIAALGGLLTTQGCTGSGGAAVSAIIGSSGGTVSAASAGVQVDVPPGAVEADTRFSIATAPTADHLAAGFREVGPMVTFGPEGSRFLVGVHITLPAASEPMVVLTRPHGALTWTRLDGAVWDGARHVVVADVMHFSDFVPVGPSDVTSDDGGVPDASIDCSDPRFADYPICRRGYECDIVDTTAGCAEGYANCYPTSATTTHGVCAPSGDGLDGRACTFRGLYDGTEATFSECSTGTYCSATVVGASGVCRRLCDGAHGCGSADFECRSMGALFGFCEPVRAGACLPFATTETNCENGYDDDCNGQSDCADAQCAGLASCGACIPRGPEELECDNGVDEDCNGQTDCADVSCATASVCHDISTCDPLAASTTCTSGHCAYFAPADDRNERAACVALGTHAPGDACMLAADCGAGATCAAPTSVGADPTMTVFEGYFSRGGGTCAIVCDPAAAGGCPGGTRCRAVYGARSGAVTGRGVCR